MELIQILHEPQQRKSNFCKSYFDIPKYAQMGKVLVCRNILKYDNMDECGIGTDCKPLFFLQPWTSPLCLEMLLKFGHDIQIWT